MSKLDVTVVVSCNSFIFFLALDFPWSILLKFCACDLPVKGFLLGIFVCYMRSSVFCNVRNSGFLEMWILGICFMVASSSI